MGGTRQPDLGGESRKKMRGMEQLATALQDEMANRGHSYRDAAKVMGVSVGSVSNWSKGWIEDSPKLRSLEAIADYLGVPLYIVFGYIGWLTEDEVNRLAVVTPGSLSQLDAIALSWAESRGYLRQLDFEPLAVGL